ncbi:MULTISPECIES: hypothetical protein [unclassified Streptomyces]|uniref:hypothetical protein n=1 Tax=unclassified Streptomyces TaxID=2593676 RepID=UPI00325490E8
MEGADAEGATPEGADAERTTGEGTGAAGTNPEGTGAEDPPPAPGAEDAPASGAEDAPARTRGPAVADGEDPPQGPPAPDDEGSTGGAGGNDKADGEAEATKPPPGRRRLRRLTLTFLLALLLPTLTAESALRLNYTGDPKQGTYTRNRDAIWLGHAWVDGRKTDADVTALADRLKTTGIRDLYVHAGPLEHNGTLPKSAYPKARWLIAAVHRAAPGIRVQAWLGDVLATESPTGMRLERPATRAAVVASTRQILATGFDGAHFDLEPLHSGDRNYLTLLDSLHAVTRAHHAQLSVAAHQIDPLPGFHSFWGTVAGHPKWWSQKFFGQVARRVDQIAVMSYDTMQPLQSLYGGYVAQQTSLALEVTPKSTDLLMGLPFYHENRFGHWNHAETVPAAVRGVRLGLSRTDADRERFGVALYVDFAATEADWTAYRDDWVH